MKNEKQMSTSHELYVVAKIVSCFGIKGYVKVLPMTHSPERIGELSSVQVGMSDQDTTGYSVADVQFQSRTIVLKFKEIEDRTQAEDLVGNFIFVGKDELAEPPEGVWFIHDIIGCEVFTEDGAHVGTVQEVWKMSADDIWEIIDGDRHLMFPAAKRFIRNVDLTTRRIVVAPPEGLFDL